MEIVVKKLLEINIKGKTFAIFVTSNHRRTFLEVKNNEYYYPSKEDYIFLNNIYNNFNDNILPVPKGKYIEKVRITAASLATVTLVSLGVGCLKEYKVKSEDNSNDLIVSEVVENELQNNIYLNKPQDLDRVISEDITLDMVHLAIDNNPNLPLKYKCIWHILVNEVSKNYPEADLRILYLNIQNLQVNNISEEDLQEQQKQSGLGAAYNVTKNQISAPIDASFITIGHELSHPFRSIYLNMNGNIIKDNEFYSQTSFVKEAMTSKINDLFFPNKDYAIFRAVVDYLAFNDSYNISDFINSGVSFYVKNLKEKYSTVDIDFIMDTLESIKQTLINFNVEIKLDNNPYLLDELFQICLLNVSKDSNNVYNQFINFASLFKYCANDNVFYEYLDKYNNYLKELGYENIITKEEMESFLKQNYIPNFIYLEESNSYLVESDLLKDIEGREGNKDLFLSPKDYASLTLTEQINYLKYYNKIEDNLIWVKTLSESFIPKENLGVSRYYLNGENIPLYKMYNLSIQVGMNEDNKIAFKITNEEDKLIYGESIYKPSYRIALIDYLKYFVNYSLNSKVDIEKYLDNLYLSLAVAQNNYLFSNLDIENEELKITPSYMLFIEKEIPSVNLIKNIWVVINEDGTYSFKLEKEDGAINLYEIFKSEGILKEDEYKYQYTTEQLEDIVDGYLQKENRKR